MTIIDPPAGWMYGFPKQLPDTIDPKDEKQLAKWLIDQGYPIRDLSLALRYSRLWEQS